MIQLGVGPRGWLGKGRAPGTRVWLYPAESAPLQGKKKMQSCKKMQKQKQTLAVKDPTSGLPETTSSSLALIKPKVGPVRLRTMKVGMYPSRNTMRALSCFSPWQDAQPNASPMSNSAGSWVPPSPGTRFHPFDEIQDGLDTEEY